MIVEGRCCNGARLQSSPRIANALFSAGTIAIPPRWLPNSWPPPIAAEDCFKKMKVCRASAKNEFRERRLDEAPLTSAQPRIVCCSVSILRGLLSRGPRFFLPRSRGRLHLAPIAGTSKRASASSTFSGSKRSVRCPSFMNGILRAATKLRSCRTGRPFASLNSNMSNNFFIVTNKVRRQRI
jgi:hypothetical protein